MLYHPPLDPIDWLHHRNAIGIELNPEYIEQSRRRLDKAMEKCALLDMKITEATRGK